MTTQNYSEWKVTGKTGKLNQIGIGIDTGKGIDPIGCAYGEIGEATRNAHMMAASMEMLKALEALVKRLDLDSDVQKFDWLHSEREAARAAIAKTKGEL